MRSVTVRLGEFAVEALAGDGERGSGFVSMRVAQAVQYYLNERRVTRPGWSYPSFLRDREGEDVPGEGGETLELSIDEKLWAAFEAEADRQKISVGRLAEHAALYFVADLNAGRITERILGDLN